MVQSNVLLEGETRLDLGKILTELKAERERLDRAIRALDGTAPQLGRPRGSRVNAPSAPQGRERRLSAKGRRRLSASMKRRWAERKKAGKKSLAA